MEFTDIKIAILSLSGSIGKTSLAAHMLYPRLNCPTVFAVETINETVEWYGLKCDEFRGDQFDELITRILRTKNVLVDTGASNIEAFVKNLVRHDNAHQEIDLFIVPVPTGAKEQSEAVKTTELLRGLGVPPNKVRVLFNCVRDDVEKEFKVFLAEIRALGFIEPNLNAVVFYNRLFNWLHDKHMHISTLLNDQTDYKQLLGSDASDEQLDEWAEYFANQMAARSVSRNLDSAFNALLK
ncbi:hypothetical protein AAKU67_001895 [Oxalobacteraceae bacterium GrIS 2.11]